MTYQETPTGFVLRFFTGEEIYSGLVEFARAKGITAAWVQGLGALERAEIGYFDLHAKQYLRREITEDVEVAPLVGNLSRHEGEPIPHLHVTLGRRDFTALAGHLFSGHAGATLEIGIWNWGGLSFERRADAQVGLNLLSFPNDFAPAR